jgi:hypothetical protein
MAIPELYGGSGRSVFEDILVIEVVTPVFGQCAGPTDPGTLDRD